MRRASRQLEFVIRTHGGARRRAGRKPAGRRPGVPHRPRTAFSGHHPVHVTLRVVGGMARLRTRASYGVVAQSLRMARAANLIRVVHYSVMTNHLHLLVEAPDRTALARGLQGLSIRMARALNRLRGRTGSVFADRYHARVLRTPLEVRRALAYVLNNARRHGIVGRDTSPRWLDPYSSAGAFDGWGKSRGGDQLTDVPVARARTWLLRAGWRRHGLLDPAYAPG